MATQDFIAGGFYGKVGVLVGQRWKNKRTVRSYVIPHNPRTPDQQSNRARFASAVKSVQQALIYNKGAPCWDNERITEYQWRTSVAKNRIDNKVVGWLAMPLFPDGTTPEVTVADVSMTTNAAGHYVLQSDTIAELTESRSFTMSVTMYDTQDQQEINYYFQGTTVPGETELVEIDVDPRYILQETATVIGISNDDRTHDGKIIYIAPQDIEVAEQIVINDITAEYTDDTTLVLKSNIAKQLVTGFNIQWEYTLTSGATLDKVTHTQNAETTIGSDVFATLTIPANEACFENETFSAKSISVTSGTQKITVPDFQLGLGQKTVTSATVTVAGETITGNNSQVAILAQLPWQMATPNAAGAWSVAGVNPKWEAISGSGTIAGTAATAQNVHMDTVTLSDVPVAFGNSQVTVTAATLENDVIKLAFTASGDITAANQEMHTVTGSQMAISNIAGATRMVYSAGTITGATTVQAEKVGFNIFTEATVSASGTRSLPAPSGGNITLDEVPTDEAWLLSGGGSFKIWQGDYMTAAKVEVFEEYKPAQTTVTGDLTSAYGANNIDIDLTMQEDDPSFILEMSFNKQISGTLTFNSWNGLSFQDSAGTTYNQSDVTNVDITPSTISGTPSPTMEVYTVHFPDEGANATLNFTMRFVNAKTNGTIAKTVTW